MYRVTIRRSGTDAPIAEGKGRNPLRVAERIYSRYIGHEMFVAVVERTGEGCDRVQFGVSVRGSVSLDPVVLMYTEEA